MISVIKGLALIIFIFGLDYMVVKIIKLIKSKRGKSNDDEFKN